jgi:hypothetical protein
MREASYAVVRYIADPARSEPLNVGIIIWTEKGWSLRVDEAAVARVVRENPRLERDALLYLDAYLRRELATRVPPFTEEGFLRVIKEQTGFPVLISEPRATMVGGETVSDINAALGQLVSRIVTPRRRSGGSGLRVVSFLERELRPYVERQAISRHHTFIAPRTGVTRSVDFYANSRANVALDVVNLALVRADEIRLRADAEAFKIWDLLADGDLNEYLVYCEFPPDDKPEGLKQNATKIMESTGGRVTRDLDEAIEVLASAARDSQLFT